MDGFKEFTGKNLDEAIEHACTYYDASRERLEIDIIQDSKSGIFGLVGARKAIIQAKRVELRNAVDNILGRTKKSSAAEKTSPAERQRDEKGKQRVEKQRVEKEKNTERTPEKKVEKNTERALEKKVEKNSERALEKKVEKNTEPLQGSAQDDSEAQSTHNGKNQQTGKGARIRKERNERTERERSLKSRNEQQGKNSSDSAPKERHKPKAQHHKAHAKLEPKANILPNDDGLQFDDVEETENVPRIPLESLDQERLNSVTLEAVRMLTRLIVGDVPMSMSVVEGRVSVHLDCDENSGLLIGREGQTLAALQYITSRIVSRAMSAAVRVQLDAGDYRSRQDEKLGELALILAEKVRQTGKAHSTRPLSSYHRRLVHVALQQATDLHTRSSGEGPLKRVIIQRKR